MCDLSLNGNPEGGGCLAGDEKTQVTTNSRDQNFPSISGGKIVWLYMDNDYSFRINGYLTIMAAPDVVPFRKYMYDSDGYPVYWSAPLKVDK